MRFAFLTLAVVLIAAVTPAWSQQNRTLLLVPFEMRGTYQPISQNELSNLLKKYIEETAPHVTVKIASSGAAMIDAKLASRLGKQAGTDFVLFGDLRFRKDLKAASLSGSQPDGYPGGSGIPMGHTMRYSLTIAGVAHGSLVGTASEELFVDDEPQLLLESEMTGAVKDGPKMQELEKRLVDSCVHQVSRGLVEAMDESAKKAAEKNLQPTP